MVLALKNPNPNLAWKTCLKFLYLIDRLRISPHCANLSKFIQNYVFFLFAAKYFNPRKWASNGPRLLSAALASQCDLNPDEFSHTLSIGPGKDVSDQNYVEKTVIILKGILRNILQEIM